MLVWMGVCACVYARVCLCACACVNEVCVGVHTALGFEPVPLFQLRDIQRATPAPQCLVAGGADRLGAARAACAAREGLGAAGAAPAPCRPAPRPPRSGPEQLTFSPAR